MYRCSRMQFFNFCPRFLTFHPILGDLVMSDRETENVFLSSFSLGRNCINEDDELLDYKNMSLLCT